MAAEGEVVISLLEVRNYKLADGGKSSDVYVTMEAGALYARPETTSVYKHATGTLRWEERYRVYENIVRCLFDIIQENWRPWHSCYPDVGC